MIRAFSERLMPPYSGQVQIAESDTYRALTIDGGVWEIQYVNRSHVRVATMTTEEVNKYAANPQLLEAENSDTKLIQLIEYLAEAKLPFTATDCYEYWLLDASDQSPLALIFSCSEESQMEKFPARAEWTALPAAVMPIVKTETETLEQTPPVNYRVERMVAERAGINPRAAWFNARRTAEITFPPLLIREDWEEDWQTELCQRYISRQAPRLLMLHGLGSNDRSRIESFCKAQAIETARFHNLYPDVIDKEMIKSVRVEAMLRASSGGDGIASVENRRDGVLYI